MSHGIRGARSEVLEHEVCLLKSAAVWHVRAIGFVSRHGECPLQQVCARVRPSWRRHVACDCGGGPEYIREIPEDDWIFRKTAGGQTLMQQV